MCLGFSTSDPFVISTNSFNLAVTFANSNNPGNHIDPSDYSVKGECMLADVHRVGNITDFGHK